VADRIVKYIFQGDETGATRAMSRVESSATKTGKSLDDTGKKSDQLGKHFSGLKGTLGGLVSSFGGLGGLGAVLGGAGVVSAISSITSKTSELATQTETFHAISGLGANQSLRYTAALQARGIGAEAGGKAFRFLAKNMQLAERQEYTYGTAQAKAAEKGKQATGLLGVQALAFHRLGIQSASAFKGLSSEQQFQTVIRAFSHMKDGAEKTQLALQIFGRGGTALLPVLNETSLGLEHQYQVAKKFFPTLKGEGVKSLEELKEKQAESKLAWEGLEFTIGTKLIPVITELDTWFSHTISEVERGQGAFGEFAKGIEGVVHFGEKLAGLLKEIAAHVGIKISGGTLGALMLSVGAAGGVEHALHPVKHTGTAVKAFGKLANFTKGHPELAPVALGAAVGIGVGVGAHEGAKALGIGNEAEYQRTHPLYGGRFGMGAGPAAGPSFAAQGKPAQTTLAGEIERGFANALRSIAGSPQEAGKVVVEAHLHVDGKLMAQNTSEHALRDPLTKRNLTEAVTHYGLQRHARE
jgi:hypothetical protein